MRALWIVLALAGTASAGTPKPPADQAKQTAEAWLEALGDKPDAALALTGDPLTTIIVVDGPHPADCPAQAKGAAAIGKALACVAKAGPTGSVEAWSKDAARAVQAPLKGKLSKITAFEKTATLVHRHEKCAGQGSDLIVAVAADPADKAKAKVVAVFYQAITCGE